LKVRVNKEIRARELRVIDAEDGNLGVLSFDEALAKAVSKGLDLIEISPQANPPIAKIMDFGKWQYSESKKQKKAKSGAKPTETKAIQIKIGTSEHDLELKAKQASNWLKEGHRIKVELYLSGRAKYLADAFLKERLERVLNLITENYKIAEAYKKGPRGPVLTIERDTHKQTQ
jgi:translation initiation factor IF-3